METNLPTPMTARVYVNLPEGNTKMGKAICGPASFLEQCLPGNDKSFGRLGSGAATEEFRTTGGYAA